MDGGGTRVEGQMWRSKNARSICILTNNCSRHTKRPTSNLYNVIPTVTPSFVNSTFLPFSYLSFFSLLATHVFRSNGVTCVVKCTGWNYENAPKSGTVLNIKHSGIFDSSKKFKYPFLLRVRPDLNWQEVQNQ